MATDPESFMAIFATSGDCAEIIADVLSGHKVDFKIFNVIHNCFEGFNTAAGSVQLDLCLPTKRPGCGSKYQRVLRLRLPPRIAHRFLIEGKPISTQIATQCLDVAFAETTFRPLIEVLVCNKPPSSDEPPSLRSQIYWHRTKFVASLRKMYKITSSPYWLVATFGSHEAQFILTATFYYFAAHRCTVDTIIHLSRLYEPRHGRSLVSVNSFAEMSAIFSSSAWLAKAGDFRSFVLTKLQRDDFESRQVDAAVNAFRGQLILSNHDLIQYIYLAFFQCLNKKNFLDYSEKTSPGQLAHAPKSPLLTKYIDDDFKRRMTTYYNQNTYLSTHVTATCLSVPADPHIGYDRDLDAAAPRPAKLWIGHSADVSELLTKLLEEFPHTLLTPDLQGLLDVGGMGSCRDSAVSRPLETLFPSEGQFGSLPVFRCQFLDKNYFAIVRRDNLSQFWQKHVIFPPGEYVAAMEDTDLTQAIMYTDRYFSFYSLADQLKISRHEYFNPRLPVFNLVLDFDLKLGGSSLSLAQIYHLAVSVRDDILRVLKLMGDVEPSHPVYFFKSACPYRETAIGERLPYCTCVEKLGMRIITPLPKGRVVVGGATMVSLVNIINRLVRLNPEISSMCPQSFLESSGPLDVGIYNKGRCIRLPYTYKVEKGGQLNRLLKLFVCHPDKLTRGEYLANATRLKNLLHHSRPEGWPDPTVIFYEIRDNNENFLTIKTQENLPKTPTNVIDRIEAREEMDMARWLNAVAWPQIYQVITTYLPDDKVHQFNTVRFVVVNQRLVQVKPFRGDNFKCLKFKHRSNSPTVRVFLILHMTKEEHINITFMSQCFTDKCHNNKSIAHFSCAVRLRGSDGR
ncbi:helicase-primase primase subunit [Common bottlenose dolphin gammaherpesvirus 1 strain Sarasota]|uniref:Helicase-primase primase subunit n=1 Tax=Common bottlenose dolphin gammaherpesvirus 1 strain Sarasota TaxID=2022783 RepID=A0A1Z1NEA7_9GAMA|nr:helicase-primase primase subunit [Common bottlenose dolphin gammaherpesvirus 1 strain Sarasota]ARW78118.1 helicase-primase primase subunit [Common bottlenose dolphin gammaherpesvirus 1 strain Sarasota]